MNACCLMVQGTASGVGKSLLATALCRLFARRGYRVAPFKAQNMALNAAVTPDGLEIGRSQAAQAEAAGVEPSVDMNPILLKPEGDDRSQVVVRGVAVGRLTFGEYRARRDQLVGVVVESLERLRQSHDLIVIEGAGSPAEINLAASDIVNMHVARLADAPVLLVGDIDRGGVFAAFVGTLALLVPEDRARVAGFVVNKFRGDAALLAPGFDALLGHTGVPVLGVIPYLDPLLVPAEDSQDLDVEASLAEPARLEIAVVRLPRIANFDDFEPLAREPGVRVRFVRGVAAVGRADLVILPGSKSTIADLAWLRASGLAAALERAVARGTPVLGICGGFQMLGETVRDPQRVESPVTAVAGLGFLSAVTTFAPIKMTTRVGARVSAPAGPLAAAAGTRLDAYEIHMGSTVVGAGARPFVVTDRGGRATEDPDGAMRDDGLVVGTYLHGVFASGALRRALLEALARRRGGVADPRWGAADQPGVRYDRLADAVAAALDVTAIGKLAGL